MAPLTLQLLYNLYGTCQTQGLWARCGLPSHYMWPTLSPIYLLRKSCSTALKQIFPREL